MRGTNAAVATGPAGPEELQGRCLRGGPRADHDASVEPSCRGIAPIRCPRHEYAADGCTGCAAGGLRADTCADRPGLPAYRSKSRCRGPCGRPLGSMQDGTPALRPGSARGANSHTDEGAAPLRRAVAGRGGATIHAMPLGMPPADGPPDRLPDNCRFPGHRILQQRAVPPMTVVPRPAAGTAPAGALPPHCASRARVPCIRRPSTSSPAPVPTS